MPTNYDFMFHMRKQRPQVAHHPPDPIASINNAAVATSLALQAEYEAMLAIVDHLPIGVFLVGRGCEVHKTNRRAREILSYDDGIWIHRGVLTASSHLETQHLHEAVALALNPHNRVQLPGEEVIVLSRPSGLIEYNALVSRLTANQDVSREPLAAIFLSETSRPIEFDPHRLEKLYKFTPAEAQVARLLVQGLKLQDSAASLGVSLNTVKTHLRNIFDKIGCDRQAEVVRIILSGVSIIQKSESRNGQLPRKSHL